MSYEITVIYPKEKDKGPRIMAAAVSEYNLEKLDLKPMEADLSNLLKMLEKLDSETSKYGVGEINLSLGVAKDTEGKIHVGFTASLLNLFRGEASAETSERLTQNRLFEIKICKK